jgi:hypothetical protein
VNVVFIGAILIFTNSYFLLAQIVWKIEELLGSGHVLNPYN